MIDTHIHSAFSFDCEAPVREVIETAIEKGLLVICLTDHMDEDLLCPDGTKQTFDPDDYFSTLEELKAVYADRIKILIGIEYGMMPHLTTRCSDLLAKYPFDFMIGSQHVVGGEDPFYPAAFAGKKDADVYRVYFEEMLENVRRFPQIDSLGHLDYIVRYGKNRAKEYSYRAFADVIDEVLKQLIKSNTALEVNTAGIRKNGFANPHPAVLRRYRELGGTLVTFGSDAHQSYFIGNAYTKTCELLKSCGFTHLCYFEKHTPRFVAI